MGRLNIISTILSEMSKRIKQIGSKINEPIVEGRYQSTCLVCHGLKMRITQTRRRRGAIIRTAVCKDCGTSNKQIVNNVSFVERDNFIYFKNNDLVFKAHQHSGLNIKNGKIKLIDPITLNRSINKNTMSIYQYTTEEFRPTLNKLLQEQYDLGLLDDVIGSIDPVEVRLILNDENESFFKYKNSRWTKAFFLLLGFKKLPVSAGFVWKMYWSLAEDGSDNIYALLIKGFYNYE